MKKILFLFCSLLALSAGCAKLDTDEIWSNIDSLDKRVTTLEELCKQMNTNIDALKALVNSEANKDYITAITPIKSMDKIIGYTITFAKAEPITIYNGKDAQTPIIGVKQDTDGVYYWTLNGEWLLDEDGAKVQAGCSNESEPGKDGITPQLKIENGKWYVSYNNGSSWVEIGQATGPQGPQGPAGADGDSMFQSVTYDETNLYITLKDGEKIMVPIKPLCPVTLSLGGVSKVSANFNGTVSKKSFDLKVTVYYGKSADLTIYENDGKVEYTKFQGDDFILKLDGLSQDTLYYYFYEVVFNGQTFFSELASFRTKGQSVSLGAPSNCYIITKSGDYSIEAVKGNSSELVGTISSVEVLWETFGTDTAPKKGDLISSVSYDAGKVSFSTSESFNKGNAVIAAKDSAGSILWSWHIWFTDQPEDQVYNNNAGTVMDRNLGATSATPGDVGALGLIYQWGRKDPFLGSSSISLNKEAASTLSWPVAVASSRSTGTIAYAVAHPTTYITYNSSNNDWYYSGNSSTDNTRWQSSKTIYDPCPAGYRVPDGGKGGLWSVAFGWSGSFDQNTFDTTNRGFNFGSSSNIRKKLSDNVPVCWYPDAGYRNNNAGLLVSLGSYGYYWSVTACTGYGSNAYHLSFNYGNVDPAREFGRGFGGSVRCVRE